MALGGGQWTSYNKVLPGTYINYISRGQSSINLGERGTLGLMMELDYTSDSTYLEITAKEFLDNSFEILGYRYNDPKMLPFREMFKHASKVVVVTGLGGTHSKVDIPTGGEEPGTYSIVSKKFGVLCNEIILEVSSDPDVIDGKIFTTKFRGVTVDVQKVPNDGFPVDNDYIEYEASDFKVPVGIYQFTGGKNADATYVDAETPYSIFESREVDVILMDYEHLDITDEMAEHVIKGREDRGVLMQLLIFNGEVTNIYDHESIIMLGNHFTPGDNVDFYNLRFWLAGICAGVPINESLTNRKYDGEIVTRAITTQKMLIEGIESGFLMLHMQGDEIRILKDINTLVTFTDEKNKSFNINQVIRTLDAKSKAIATVFNDKYLGKVPNDNAGRESFWADMVTINEELARLRAIEPYDPASLTVERGVEKGDVVVVDAIEPVSAMEKLYCTIYVI